MTTKPTAALALEFEDEWTTLNSYDISNGNVLVSGEIMPVGKVIGLNWAASSRNKTSISESIWSPSIAFCWPIECRCCLLTVSVSVQQWPDLPVIVMLDLLEWTFVERDLNMLVPQFFIFIVFKCDQTTIPMANGWIQVIVLKVFIKILLCRFQQSL